MSFIPTQNKRESKVPRGQYVRKPRIKKEATPRAKGAKRAATLHPVDAAAASVETAANDASLSALLGRIEKLEVIVAAVAPYARFYREHRAHYNLLNFGGLKFTVLHLRLAEELMKEKL